MKKSLSLKTIFFLALFSIFNYSAANAFEDESSLLSSYDLSYSDNAIGNCAGTSTSCGEFAVANCVEQKGCFVLPDGKKCSGVSVACLMMTNESSSHEQKGCGWVP